MITIAIPLHKESGWGDNQELKFFLRSIDKFLHVDYEVKLYYNRWPGWLNPEMVKYEQVKRYYPAKAYKYWNQKKQYENYFDTLHKLQRMSQDSVADYILYCYDDQILLRDVYSFEDISQWIATKNYWDNPKGFNRRGNKWSRTVMKAFDVLCELERPMYDYETHLPRMFKKDELREMFDRFPIEQQIIPYAPSTLYGNLYNDSPDHILLKENKVKLGYYGDGVHLPPGSFKAKSISDIDSQKKGKLWMNYNDKGMRVVPLKEWMEKEFSEKSKFEL